MNQHTNKLMTCPDCGEQLDNLGLCPDCDADDDHQEETSSHGNCTVFGNTAPEIKIEKGIELPKKNTGKVVQQFPLLTWWRVTHSRWHHRKAKRRSKSARAWAVPGARWKEANPQNTLKMETRTVMQHGVRKIRFFFVADDG